MSLGGVEEEGRQRLRWEGLDWLGTEDEWRKGH